MPGASTPATPTMAGTNIYTNSLPVNLSDTTIAVAVWARVSCLWAESSKSTTEVKWQRVQSQVLKWKAKLGTKKTSHRPSRYI